MTRLYIPAMPEQRRLVTVLFADIVGSTALGSAHDPEVVRRTLARAFAQMREVLEGHGATVEKFIGDAVMAVFGIPQGHDDDADRAVRAAFVLRDVTAFHYPGNEEMLVITFTQQQVNRKARVTARPVRKRQYWAHEGNHWKIVSESIL